ncbi:MAG: alpha-L-fucosidase, partial [Gemmatimonadota bacterium]
KGGNYLLNVGPTPEGTFENTAYERLAEIGAWMRLNGEGIYDTRQHSVFGQGDHLRFTSSKDSRTVFVFALEWPGDILRLPDIDIAGDSEIALLGHEEPLEWVQDGDGLHVALSDSMRNVSNYAWTFRVRQR